MHPLTPWIALARRLLSALEDWFFAPADARAYAALRIGYGASALAILIDLFPLRVPLLSESGLLGGAAPEGFQIVPNVFVWARSEAAVTAVFVVAGVAAVCLCLGVAQRFAAILVYWWVVSYSRTAPTALSGFDTILRTVGFVMVISPTVPTWSIPWSALPRRAMKREPPVYGLRLVQWQVALIYLCTAWLKSPDEFWRNGEAVTYFLMSMFARFPSPKMADFGPIGALLTYGTVIVELALPFLLWSRRLRFLGVALGFALHAGIAVSSKIALFSLAILALYPAFFESEDFDRLRVGRAVAR